jgi:steroid delta-isomerase-like uncharacterized protein
MKLSKEQIKTRSERSLDVWNKGDFTVVDEMFAPDFVRREVDIAEDVVGLEAFKEFVTNVRISYPDFTVTVDELIVAENKTIPRWTITGTNTGARKGVPATGKKMKVSGVTIASMSNGKTTEELVFYNQAALLAQLGFTITPPSTESDT